MLKTTFDRLIATDQTAPGFGSKTVTPSDTDDIWANEVARQLVIFDDGDVTFIGADGVSDTWTFAEGLSYPQVIDVAVKRVMSTGTTVTTIKAIR